MDSKLAANYDEFEPLCNWKREEGRDTLVVHLPEFNKEQLRVQLSNLGVLKISGERPQSALKQSRFYKEVKVAKECNTNDIRAKFGNGLLYVVMPKTTTAVPEKVEASSASEQVQANKQPDDHTASESAEEKTLPSEQGTYVPTPSSNKQPDDHTASESAEEKTLPSEQGTYVPTPSSSNMGIKLALVITLASIIGIYLYYRYTRL